MSTTVNESKRHLEINATEFDGQLDGTIKTNTTATTQSAGDNSTKVATTAYADAVLPGWVPSSNPNYLTSASLSGYATENYVQTQVTNLIDSAPSALNTLNELAAALGDDANFSTTVTNSIAAKLPLAGGTMSGDIVMGDNDITGVKFIQANDNVDIRTGSGEYALHAAQDGQVALYTNGTKKFETMTTGATVFSTTATFLIEGDGVTSSNLKFRSNSVDRWNVNVPSGQTNLAFTTGSTDVLSLDTSNNATFAGQVGIGTAAASGVELHVNGEVRVDDNNGVATRMIRSNYFSASSDIEVRSGASGDIILGDGTSRLTLASNDTATFAGAATFAGNVTVNKLDRYMYTVAANDSLSYTYGTRNMSMPVNGYLWHDLLGFDYNYTRTQEISTDGTNFSSHTLDKSLFAQKQDQSITVIDTNEKAVRWTFQGVAWSLPDWINLAFTYVSSDISKDVLVESSTNGSTWTTRHTSTVSAGTATKSLYISSFGGDSYLRLTITKNPTSSTNVVRLSSIRLMTARAGDQGQGMEFQFPYTWDYDRRVAIGHTPTTGTYEASLAIKGLTADSTANSLVIRNSSNTSLLSVRNDGRVDMPSGNVHITNDLTVNGAANIDGNLTLSGGALIGDPNWDIYAEYTNRGRINLLSNNSADTNVQVALMTNGNNRLTIDKAGTSTFAGDVHVGANYMGRDGDNYIGFVTDNLIKFRVNGATQVKISDGVLSPQTDSDVDLGTNSVRFANIYGDTLYGDGSNLTGINTTDSTKLPLAGGTMTGDLILGDNVKLEIGSASGGDLQLYHDGTHSWISDQGQGNLTLLTSAFVVNNAADSENMIIASADGSVNLYYDGSQKFRTVSSGAEVTGNLIFAGGSSIIDQGAIYIQDTAAGRIGWNRNTSNGAIHDSNYNAFQAQVNASGASGKFEIQAYSGAGGYGGSFFINATAQPLINDYILHNGNENTKIGFSGSDTFIVNTGGTTALTVDSSQNATIAGSLGVGGSPGARLDVNAGATNTVAIFESTDDKAFIKIKDNDTDAHLIAKDNKFSIGESSSDYDNFKVDITSGNTNVAGTFTAGGQITGTELEGTSLDINGNADISGTIDSSHITSIGTVKGQRLQAESSSFPQQFIIDSTSGGGNSRTMQIGMAGTSLYLKKSDDTGSVIFRNSNNTDLMTIGLGNSGQVTVLNELEAGSLDINGNADISGTLNIHDEIITTAAGSLLEIYKSTWSNATNHDILYQGWDTTVDDYIYLKAPGNTTTAHGIALIGDNVIAFGKTNVETGSPELTSAAAPLNNNWLVLNNTGATFSGNIAVSGTVDGRDLATDGTKLDGIDASADVTDATTVAAAGALMDSEVTNLAQVKAFDSSDYATAAQGTKADTAHGWGNHASGGYATLSGTQTFTGTKTFNNIDIGGGTISGNVALEGNILIEDGQSIKINSSASHPKFDWTSSNLTLMSAQGYKTTIGDNVDVESNLEVGGDLTVTGGDIILSGTGKITGIDTVTAATHAANKSYVDTQVATRAASSHTHTFASLTSKPTTISGYGITDAFDGAYGSLSGTPTIPSGNQIIDWTANGAGTIHASNYTNTTYTKASFDLDHLFTLVGASADTSENMGAYTSTSVTPNQTVKQNIEDLSKRKENIIVACSDETSDLTTGTGKVTFRMPYAMQITDVRASLTTAANSGIVTVDIHLNGTSIFASSEEEGHQRLTIDAGEKTSTTATNAYNFVSSASLVTFGDDAEVRVDLDAVGTEGTGKGLKVTLIGYQR